MILKNKSSFDALPKRTPVPLDEPLHWVRFFNFKYMEIWKDIPGYEGYYQVSDLGRVKRLERITNWRFGKKQLIQQKILTSRKQNSGYYCVNLTDRFKKNKNVLTHRLVMLAFVGQSSLTVNHKNEDKFDNRLINLEYMSHKDNVTYSRGKKLIDIKTNKIYLSQREAARDLYAELGYKQWDCLHTAIRRGIVNRLQRITE